jgi:SAM-dependent methyltransferase
MRESLLESLVEPTTHAPLRLTVRRHAGDAIEEGTLTSDATGRDYPIVGGIPRFVPASTYTDTFGRQWNRFRRTQLDSVTGSRYSEELFDRDTGWTRADLDGKRVLDAGCGAGRFSEIAAVRGARVVALDMSGAVEAARETLGRFPTAELVQASLYAPPFRPGIFDFAYCLRVVQHTPDPPQAIRAVVELVRRDGRFAFAIYGRRPWTRLHGKYLLRPLTRRIPAPALLRGIEASMPLLFPVTDALFRAPGPLGALARFTIPVANYVDKDGFTRAQRYEEAILDTFDMLSPRFDSPMTWKEVDRALVRGQARSWKFRSRVPVIVEGTC